MIVLFGVNSDWIPCFWIMDTVLLVVRLLYVLLRTLLSVHFSKIRFFAILADTT